MMDIRAARTVLGFKAEGDINAADIRRFFAIRVKECHPDSATAPYLPYSMANLKDARNVLLQSLETPRGACGNCRGSGTVTGKWGAVVCGACGGTGETR